MIVRARRSVTCAVLLLGAALLGCARDPVDDYGAERDLSALNDDPPQMRDVRVIDGDTLVIEGETIRLANIDAPEKPPRARCYAEARLSWDATAELERLVRSYYGDRAGVRISREGKDQYGRTLARVSLGADDLGDRLMQDGRAVPWRGQRWDWCGAVDPASEDGRRLVRNPELSPDEVVAELKADAAAAAEMRPAG